MQRLTFASLLVVGVIGAGSLGTIATAAEGKLKVGDPAPPLAVSTWLHGAPVKGFEPGRAYVVEFWATWCGPCIQIMPHMGDLQDEYREKGVTFIGFASEANDKEAKVNAFVAKHGKAGLHVCLWQRIRNSHRLHDSLRAEGHPLLLRRRQARKNRLHRAPLLPRLRAAEGIGRHLGPESRC